MKIDINALSQVKEKLKEIKGNQMNFKVNRGRKKIEDLTGTVETLYPSVFTIKFNEYPSPQTFSYFDVLCGLVKFKEKEENA